MSETVTLTDEQAEALDEYVEEHPVINVRSQALSRLIELAGDGGDLADLGSPLTASAYSADRLEYVLRSLEKAESLDSGLEWSSFVGGLETDSPCTVEELIGGLREADQILALAKEAEDGCTLDQ